MEAVNILFCYFFKRNNGYFVTKTLKNIKTITKTAISILAGLNSIIDLQNIVILFLIKRRFYDCRASASIFLTAMIGRLGFAMLYIKFCVFLKGSLYSKTRKKNRVDRVTTEGSQCQGYICSSVIVSSHTRDSNREKFWK